MLWPLILMALAFKFYYLWVLLVRMKTEIIAQRIRAFRLRQVQV